MLAKFLFDGARNAAVAAAKNLSFSGSIKSICHVRSLNLGIGNGQVPQKSTTPVSISHRCGYRYLRISKSKDYELWDGRPLAGSCNSNRKIAINVSSQISNYGIPKAFAEVS